MEKLRDKVDGITKTLRKLRTTRLEKMKLECYTDRESREEREYCIYAIQGEMEGSQNHAGEI